MTVNVSKPALNVREKLAELDKPTGIAGEAMLRAETPQEQFQLIGAGRRNLLINGDFQVSQRGDYSSLTSYQSGDYSLDRWANRRSGVNASVQHNDVTLPNGKKTKSLRVEATSTATGYMSARQIIEDWRLLSGQQITVSLWIKTNHPDVRLRRDSGEVSGADLSDPLPNTGNWEYFTFTTTWVDVTQTSASTGIVVLTYNNGNVSITSGDYFEIANVQLELGKVATPFEHRSYGEELALCQRYFRQINSSSAEINIIGSGMWDNSTNARVIVHHPVEMRTAPTYTASSAGHLAVGEVGVGWRTGTGTSQIYTRDGFSSLIRVDIASSGATPGEGAFVGLNSGSGYYVRFDAEL